MPFWRRDRNEAPEREVDEPVDPVEWEQHLRKSQDSLRVLAELTGGIAVNQGTLFIRNANSLGTGPITLTPWSAWLATSTPEST